jgi:hypothetical protein
VPGIIEGRARSWPRARGPARRWNS